MTLLVQVILIAACTPGLPPREALERGCHVWWEKEAGRGLAASASGSTSTIHGSADVDGPTLDGETIRLRDHDIGRFDDRVLTLHAVGFNPERSARVGPPPVGSITFDDGPGTGLTFQVSPACSRSEAALGAAALFIALSD